MVVNVPDSGLALESSAKAMAGLPMQAFAVKLSDSMIEGMIECVQNGQGIQLSLGSSPVRHLRTSTRSFRSIHNTAHWPENNGTIALEQLWFRVSYC